jgi:hypothetical protein
VLTCSQLQILVVRLSHVGHASVPYFPRVPLAIRKYPLIIVSKTPQSVSNFPTFCHRDAVVVTPAEASPTCRVSQRHSVNGPSCSELQRVCLCCTMVHNVRYIMAFDNSASLLHASAAAWHCKTAELKIKHANRGCERLTLPYPVPWVFLTVLPLTAHRLDL